MIVLGDISGIQSYLFDVAEAGGGQARRLRARSFGVQLLAECAALRTLRTLGWPIDRGHYLLSAAGKFLLRGPAGPRGGESLSEVRRSVGEWLLREARGELRLALAWADGDGPEEYRTAQYNLQVQKACPWGPAGGAWDPTRLVLQPLDCSCALCGRAPACRPEPEPDTRETREVCENCWWDLEWGRRLPAARWLVVREGLVAGHRDVLGFGVEVSARDRVGGEFVALSNYENPRRRPAWCPAERFIERRLSAHVPLGHDRTPVWFTDLARRARGDQLLAVLKADVDSLGVTIDGILGGPHGLDGMADFSRRLDEFFAGTLNGEAARQGSIYTVFAGGDDLVMVGPWDVMFWFAGRIDELFRAAFPGLTLSAGLAVFKPKRPIKGAVAEAERLLEEAKAPPKGQCAALGQVWRWSDHAAISGAAQRLADWVDGGHVQRGWLHTLLELGEARRSANPMAAARLAYHVGRNWRSRGPAEWAGELVERFDDETCVEARYLPAIVRHALAATRTPGEED